MLRNISRSGNDLFDRRGLGVGIVLYVVPPSGCKLTFGAFIQLTVLGSGAQPVAEQQHALHLRTVDGAHAAVHPRSRSRRNRCANQSGSRNWSTWPAASKSGRYSASSAESMTVSTMSITGFAASLGTEVDPTCSTCAARAPSAARMRFSSRAY